MCKINSEIHFCTCTSIKKKPLPNNNADQLDLAEYEKTHFIWTLYKYLGEKDDFMLGEIILPVEGLGEEMTSKNLLKQLNFRNCFDFDYSPSEGDNLKIRNEYIYKGIKAQTRPDLYDYMSFIFRNGEWKADFYDVFTDKTKLQKKGIVQFK